MQSFLTRHSSSVKGVISGMDRVRFRGTIRWLASLSGMGSFLGSMRVRFTEFTDWAKDITTRLKQGATRMAEDAGRPVVYLPGSRVRKETIAREIAHRDHITRGLICVLTCVEPCHTFSVGPNRERKLLELRMGPGKCLYHYFYLLHPELGLMHLRMQTWLPLTIHLCINGREWLANLMRRTGIGFQQCDNCFIDIDDIPAAQTLLDQQLRTDWPGLFNGLLHQLQPAYARLFGPEPLNYYWSAEQTEWATDILFHSPDHLAAVYPGLLRHAMQNFGSADVMRFLGRPVTANRVHHRFGGEVVTTLRTRPEGTRIKHALNRNSLKMYDKQGSVLRVETTINDARDMKSYRAKESDPDGPKSWQRLRKGVSDLHRRMQISQQSNERYLESLAGVDHTESLISTLEPICRPTQWKGKRVRALQPMSPDDSRLLECVARGEFHLNGFRNRDLRELLYDDATVSPSEQKRQSARITRLIRLLRGHSLIRKVPGTHRYQLTVSGRTTIAALRAAQHASTKQLAQLAA